jgi:hypothetical protein
MAGGVLLPDEELMAVALLTAALDGVTVCTDLPDGSAFTAALPVVRVLRAGGLPDIAAWGGDVLRDNPRLSVDCYAASRAQCKELVARVRAAWMSMAGASTPQGSVSRAWEEVGPTARPEEPNTNITRFGWIAGMSVRPPRAGS